MRDIVVIRGAGDLATGVAYRLHRCGFRVLMLDLEAPLVIRRTVSFAQAIYDGEIDIEGVKGRRVNDLNSIVKAWDNNEIPIVIDEKGEYIKIIRPKIVVDAILAKKNLGTNKNMADIVIALGPGFEAGIDVDAVIETQRGHYLGKVITEGPAIADTGIPGNIGGFSKERVIHAPSSGYIEHRAKISDIVRKDDIIALIDDTPVKASIDGVLRGLINKGLYIKKGLKIADIDPRDVQDHCFSISDKARSIAGGVLEAIIYFLNNEEN
ncbi:MAG: selenium-dependent molybdenum cofactor biosynthesis protein YqeB [Andreesenia angusta]|nr:selenium-dependent molybdenum cofactor biosynthesis protein YqeB [Andreesenia angusta]